jgi:hypothetical protein
MNVTLLICLKTSPVECKISGPAISVNCLVVWAKMLSHNWFKGFSITASNKIYDCLVGYFSGDTEDPELVIEPWQVIQAIIPVKRSAV